MKKVVTLSGREVEVNIDEIAEEIDNIMHERITSVSGITIDHEEIRNFVRTVIDKNNILETDINLKLDHALGEELP